MTIEKFNNELTPNITHKQNLKVLNEAVRDFINANNQLVFYTNGEFVNESCTLEKVINQTGYYTLVLIDLEGYTYTSTFVINTEGAYILCFDVFDTPEPFYINVNYNTSILSAIKFDGSGKDLNEYGVYIFKNSAVNI